jgi:hypothetical protein
VVALVPATLLDEHLVLLVPQLVFHPVSASEFLAPDECD